MKSFKLIPGRFYLSKDKAKWCCFSIDETKEAHVAAYCIRVDNHRVEYFYIDGRYDYKGEREHCLIEEIGNDN